MKLYLIPGMGVNHRLYEKQKEAGIDFTVIEWKKPLKDETFRSYAIRMSEEIKDEKFMLGGVSLGGVLASEIASFKKPEKLILISTIKNGDEFPPYFRLLRNIPLHRLIPSMFFKGTAFMANLIRPVFGKMNKEDRQVFMEMVKQADPEFIRWAIDKIINWKQKKEFENTLHIHGTHDAIFPRLFLKGKIKYIANGGHFMIRTQSPLINPIIQKALLPDSVEF